jgi:hypothetical protein
VSFSSANKEYKIISVSTNPSKMESEISCKKPSLESTNELEMLSYSPLMLLADLDLELLELTFVL